MVYIGHLDLLHVFERALRRAAMPVTQPLTLHPTNIE